jgi:hypothetical protein
MSLIVSMKCFFSVLSSATAVFRVSSLWSLRPSVRLPFPANGKDHEDNLFDLKERTTSRVAGRKNGKLHLRHPSFFRSLPGYSKRLKLVSLSFRHPHPSAAGIQKF